MMYGGNAVLQGEANDARMVMLWWISMHDQRNGLKITDALQCCQDLCGNKVASQKHKINFPTVRPPPPKKNTTSTIQMGYNLQTHVR